MLLVYTYFENTRMKRITIVPRTWARVGGAEPATFFTTGLGIPMR